MPAKQISINRLRIRFEWKVAFCIVLSFSLLLKLGFWQLDRAEQKRAMQQTLDQRQWAMPVPIDSISLENKEALKYLKVSLDGHYINDRSILISNKFHHGRMGFEVITPFQLSTSDDVIFVNRGWTAGNADPRQLPEIVSIKGEQHLVAEIYVHARQSFFRAQQVTQQGWPLRLHHFDIHGVKELFAAPLFPYMVRLSTDSPGVLERYWPKITMNPERSSGYAIQWFAMALILIVVSVIVSTNIVELFRSK